MYISVIVCRDYTTITHQWAPLFQNAKLTYLRHANVRFTSLPIKNSLNFGGRS